MSSKEKRSFINVYYYYHYYYKSYKTTFFSTGEGDFFFAQPDNDEALCATVMQYLS